MELNAQTFSFLDESNELRQQISVRTANGLRAGRLPGMPFEVQGSFVSGTFEIERLQCTALLSSGQLVSVDDKVNVDIPAMDARYAYLTVGFSHQMVEYEQLGQTMLRPTYSFQFQTLEDFDFSDELDVMVRSVMPLLRFSIQDSRMSVDENYIAPCLTCGTDARLGEYTARILEKMHQIASHSNMPEGDAKRTIEQFCFSLESGVRTITTEALMQQLHAAARAVDYFIMRPNESEPQQVSMWSQYDVQLWLEWMLQYLDSALKTLDGVVLVDNSIDYEALKAELREEILQTLRPEIDARFEQLQQSLHESLHEQLQQTLKEYIDGTLRIALHEQLQAELSDELKTKLYDSLYKALYDALYVPQSKEEDNFIPLI